MTTSPPPTPGKRELLLEAAAVVFARQGFVATRVADIAAEAGVGKGTVYEYFSSKDELYFAVLESINQGIMARVRRAKEGASTATEALVEVMREGARMLVEQRDLTPMNLDFCAYSRGTPFERRFRQEVNVVLRQVRHSIADIIRTGQRSGELRPETDADGVATLIVGAFDGLGMQHWLDPELDPRTVTEAFAAVLCRGLRAEER